MPNTNINRNANSGAAAGAAAESTGGAGEGPMPVSALADALAAFGGQAEANGNDQGEPRGNRGRAGAAETDGAATETANAEVSGQRPEVSDDSGQTNDQESERRLPGEGNEPEAGGSEDGGELQNGLPGQGNEAEGGEAGEGEGTTEESETPIPKGLQKRLGQLVAKVRELEGKLQASGQRPEERGQRGPSPLAEITDAGELANREAQAESLLAEVEPMIARLGIAPQKVEQYLRASGVKLTDAQGNEDYSVERMADLLLEVKAQNQAVLKAAPARRAWLQNHAQAHGQAVKVYPWLGDSTDERHAEVQNILRQFPGLKAAPNYEYWVACALEGHLSTVAKFKARGQRPEARGQRPEARGQSSELRGQPGNGVRRGMPASGAGGGGSPRVPANQKKVAEAKAKVLKTGTVGALSEFLDASGTVNA